MMTTADKTNTNDTGKFNKIRLKRDGKMPQSQPVACCMNSFISNFHKHSLMYVLQNLDMAETEVKKELLITTQTILKQSAYHHLSLYNSHIFDMIISAVLYLGVDPT